MLACVSGLEKLSDRFAAGYCTDKTVDVAGCDARARVGALLFLRRSGDGSQTISRRPGKEA